MADKQISSLPAATSVDDNSLFVVEQQGAAMSASGALWKGFAVDTVQPYATAASGSATAAATSATNAAASAQAAQNSADSISGSVETAQQAAQEAAQSAQQAASSASGVAESAEAAASSAQQATQASQNASSAQAAAESASEDAQAASTSAGQSATQAQSSASAAQQSATSASASATTAQQQAQAAQSSASAAATSAIAAGEAQEAIENLGVSAETLPTGSAATVAKSVVDGIVQLLFGLPTGATGAQGIPGNSIQSITRTSGNGAPGTVDTYTVYLTDGSTGGTFNVYNGSNGTGSGDFMADGSVPMSGNLQMGGNKITNLGAPGEDTDAVRKQDLDAVADEVDKILDGTTPAYIPPATTAKIGGVIIGEGLSVEVDGTVSADSQLPAGGTTGQILTKTADGEAWANPPDTGVTTFNGRTGAVTPQAGDYDAADVGAMPAVSGGTEGQVLTKGADGAEWSTPAAAKSGDTTVLMVPVQINKNDPDGGNSSIQVDVSADELAITLPLISGDSNSERGVYFSGSTMRLSGISAAYIGDPSEINRIPTMTDVDNAINNSGSFVRLSSTEPQQMSGMLQSVGTSGGFIAGDYANVNDWCSMLTSQGLTISVRAADGNKQLMLLQDLVGNDVGRVYFRSTGFDSGELQVGGIAAPENATDAANKAYVDAAKPLTFSTISVTTSMTWGTHSLAKLNEKGFTQRVTVPLSGVTINHSPVSVSFSLADKYSGNWSDYADTYNGGLYLYAKAQQAATIDNVIFILVD